MSSKYNYKHNPITRRVLLSMLAPTIFMNLTTAIGSMADSVIIGQYLDDLSLSVVTFALPIFMAINILSALFAVGGCISMSIDSGKGQKENANKAFSVSVELMAFAGIILFLGGLFMSRTVTGWLGAGEDVFDLVEIYSRIILMGAPVFILNTGLAFFVRNDGRPTLSMIGMFSSIVSDIILNFVFVGGMGMGVEGAAYSTVIGQFISIFILTTHFFSKKNTLKFKPALDLTALRILKNGGSAALNFVYQFITILIMNHLLASLAGTNGVVIYTVVFNLTTVSLSVFEGISQTLQPMASTYFGEKSYKNIRETIRLSMIAVILICGSVTVLLEIFPQVVPVIFGLDDALLVERASVAVRIYAVSMVVTTSNVVTGYYLQSTEQSLMAAILVSLRSLVLFLIATFILGYLFGMNGIWSAYIAAEALSFVIGLLMIKAKQKKLGNVDFLLLDKETSDGILCLTFDSTKDSFGDFTAEVAKSLDINRYINSTALKHLENLGKHLTPKKGRYVEAEINRKEKKVIIRDNLTWDNPDIESYKLNKTSSYSPALGFNRLCLEGTDYEN